MGISNANLVVRLDEIKNLSEHYHSYQSEESDSFLILQKIENLSFKRFRIK